MKGTLNSSTVRPGVKHSLNHITCIGRDPLVLVMPAMYCPVTIKILSSDCESQSVDLTPISGADYKKIKCFPSQAICLVNTLLALVVAKHN